MEKLDNKSYLRKNKIYFLKDNHSVVSLLQDGRRERTLFQIPLTFFLKLFKTTLTPAVTLHKRCYLIAAPTFQYVVYRYEVLAW